jgi:hypothetical protein
MSGGNHTLGAIGGALLGAFLVYAWSQHTGNVLNVYYRGGAHINFLADRPSQSVMMRVYDSYGDEQPVVMPVSKCTVFDARNWFCEGGGEPIRAFDGRVMMSGYGGTQQLPWWRWKLTHLWESPKPAPGSPR